MKTSKLRLRPFMPLAEQVGSGYEPIKEREQYATLSYGGVTIELDYTILRYLDLDVKSECHGQAVAVFRLGMSEMLKEMEFNHDKLNTCPEEVWFRDNPVRCSLAHVWSPLSLRDNYTSTVDGSRTMVWEE